MDQTVLAGKWGSSSCPQDMIRLATFFPPPPPLKKITPPSIQPDYIKENTLALKKRKGRKIERKVER